MYFCPETSNRSIEHMENANTANFTDNGERKKKNGQTGEARHFLDTAHCPGQIYRHLQILGPASLSPQSWLPPTAAFHLPLPHLNSATRSHMLVLAAAWGPEGGKSLPQGCSCCQCHTLLCSSLATSILKDCWLVGTIYLQRWESCGPRGWTCPRVSKCVSGSG